MIRFFIYIKNFFRKRYEVVYVFQLETVLIDEDKKKDQEGIRIDILNRITTELFKIGKKIEVVDIWQDTKIYMTHYTIASAKPQEYQKLIPLFYEIYAFKKIKKVSIFTYPLEESIFKVYNKEIQVLKFKV